MIKDPKACLTEQAGCLSQMDCLEYQKWTLTKEGCANQKLIHVGTVLSYNEYYSLFISELKGKTCEKYAYEWNEGKLCREKRAREKIKPKNQCRLEAQIFWFDYRIFHWATSEIEVLIASKAISLLHDDRVWEIVELRLWHSNIWLSSFRIEVLLHRKVKRNLHKSFRTKELCRLL